MKKLLFPFSIFAFFIFYSCQNSTSYGEPKLELFSDLIDFGTINIQTDTLWKNISLKNSGTAPLKIEHVEVSCGCVVPEWSDKPIGPGEQKDIRIALVPKSMDFYVTDPIEQFEKLILVRSNSISPFTKINITGAIDKNRPNVLGSNSEGLPSPEK